jgi:hypothetical protein
MAAKSKGSKARTGKAQNGYAGIPAQDRAQVKVALAVRKEHKRKRKEQAHEELSMAIDKLATLRDILHDAAKGESGIGDGQDTAMVAHAVLVEAVSEIEQSLFDLGVIEANEYSGHYEGMFVERLGKKPAGDDRHA